jgi:uncharacterized protein (TIGR03437 family)
VSLYGLNFASDELATAESFPLPPTLSNLSVMVNGQTVPLVAVSPWQINAQLPQTTPPGNVTFQIIRSLRVAFTDSNTVAVQVPASAPSVFAYSAGD